MTLASRVDEGLQCSSSKTRREQVKPLVSFYCRSLGLGFRSKTSELVGDKEIWKYVIWGFIGIVFPCFLPTTSKYIAINVMDLGS